MDRSKARCSAFDKAVNLLTFKSRTTQEIIKRLNEKGYSSEEIDEAVEKLSYYGYLNDQNYTISYIMDNAAKKGKKLISIELEQKGIDKNILDGVYSEVNIDEDVSIDNIIKQRFSQADLCDDKVYRRIINYFLRRGFTYDSVKRVIKKYKSYDEDGTFFY
ncbi:MAG: regulatory protein RecX [Lachnospiraceae bacterium]|nr:regulatory protein RecX [Lachnospiraceae bacterium]